MVSGLASPTEHTKYPSVPCACTLFEKRYFLSKNVVSKKVYIFAKDDK